jgi:NAD(P)H-dependent FMN reductase
LEWLVGAHEIAAKPVALISASYTGGNRALTGLTETLAVMGANVLPHSLRIPQATRTVTDGRLTPLPARARHAKGQEPPLRR